MSVVQPPEAIDWDFVIDQADEHPNLTGSAREQGVQFHEWLASCFNAAAVDFERNFEWLNRSLEWEQGRYDCCDGHYVYEFKTVEGLPVEPRKQHVSQLRRYLDGLELRHGSVVYLDRNNFDVEQFLLTR